ncbi:MAG: hypothetical protein UFG06_03150, partial [Lachnospiraceae bacterium]|nr:hypothetical protein [Lachnospiraceae bacterium]
MYQINLGILQETINTYEEMKEKLWEERELLAAAVEKSDEYFTGAGQEAFLSLYREHILPGYEDSLEKVSSMTEYL